MKLIDAEFEESEYRGPLFNQLESSNILWEPGQVFEKHIGIDRAFLTTHRALFELHHYLGIPHGVVLSRYNWNYIWTRRHRRKTLPSFRLNLFIQAKRPQYGRFVPKALKAEGLKSPFWRFSLTEHQQRALESLDKNLNNRALVCYACPAFHKQQTLYKWTVEPRIVDHSTFPSVSTLTGHEAWNFSSPGAVGVANPDPIRVELAPLMTRLLTLMELTERSDEGITSELGTLARACTAAVVTETNEPDFTQARFTEAVRQIELLVNDLLDEQQQDAISFLTVYAFALLYRLDWLVVGNGS